MIDPSQLPPPPVAAIRPSSVTHHGRTVSDDYAWLRDPAYPTVTDTAVLDHLKAENAYFEAAMAPLKPTIDTLFAEMKGRMAEDDSSVPRRNGDWAYWWAFVAGAQYRRWLRRPAGGGDEQVVIDEVAEAAGHDYFRLGAMAVSPDGRLLAWTADTNGSERFTLRIRDLASGADVETVSAVVNGGVVWSAGSDAVAYTEVNEQWRTYRARLRRLGSDPAGDATLYEETQDQGFNVGLGRTQDRRFLIVTTGDHETSEVRLLPADDPEAAPLLVSPRSPKRQYEVDSAHGNLWVLTNDDHVNFRIARADPAMPGAWETVIAGSDEVYLRGITSFARHLVIQERVAGLDQIRLRTYAGDEHRVAFPEASYTAGLGTNPEYDSPDYRIGYASMVTPDTVFDYDPETRTLATRKVRAVPSGYDATRYRTERLTITARDGAQVPVSIVYPKDFPRDGSGRVYLYGYGAYGLAIPPGFSADRLSLLDRGWACAIAHIRGGDDMGYGWYLDGKAEKRWNAFTDFVDVGRGLVATGFAHEGGIAIHGGSAGGELMGVAANVAPELWGAVVADVPFVDVLATMLDDTLPLTPGEWPEWGNPITDPAAFDLIAGYSPYDNVAAQAYPPMLVTGGLNDPRVTYWEPAKWAARLRAAKTDANPLLLKINMGAGTRRQVRPLRRAGRKGGGVRVPAGDDGGLSSPLPSQGGEVLGHRRQQRVGREPVLAHIVAGDVRHRGGEVSVGRRRRPRRQGMRLAERPHQRSPAPGAREVEAVEMSDLAVAAIRDVRGGEQRRRRIGKEGVEPCSEVRAQHPAHQHRLAERGRQELVAAGLPRLAAAVTAEPVPGPLGDQHRERRIVRARPVVDEDRCEGGVEVRAGADRIGQAGEMLGEAAREGARQRLEHRAPARRVPPRRAAPAPTPSHKGATNRRRRAARNKRPRPPPCPPSASYPPARRCRPPRASPGTGGRASATATSHGRSCGNRSCRGRSGGAPRVPARPAARSSRDRACTARAA